MNKCDLCDEDVCCSNPALTIKHVCNMENIKKKLHTCYALIQQMEIVLKLRQELIDRLKEIVDQKKDTLKQSIKKIEKLS